MVDEVLALAGVQPDVELWAHGRQGRLNELVTSVMRRLDDFCDEEFGIGAGELATWQQVRDGKRPAAMLVHGDTSSSMAAALAAFNLRIPVVHVEAGLRTNDTLHPFPEEMNRQLIGCLAAFHLAPTSEAAQNLIREHIPTEQIFVTGNTGIDALRWAAGLGAPFSRPEVQAAFDSDARLVLVTAHRRESWGGGLGRIAEALKALAIARPEVRFVVPLHPNPVVRVELGDPVRKLDNVTLTEPQSYAEFARLMGRAYVILTDSGGIQEEAPTLHKPVLVCRDRTERAEGVTAGTLALVGTDPQRIEAKVLELLDDEAAYQRMARAPNPYGDGRASARIVAALRQLLDGGPMPAPFGSGYRREAVLAAAGYVDVPVQDERGSEVVSVERPCLSRPT